DLQAAKSRLNGLNQRLDVLVEQYDQAQVSLAKAEKDLAAARQRAAEADAEARSAQRALSRRASLAYQGVGSELDVLLGSSSISQFSDRLEFLNQIAGTDQTVVSRASVAGHRAKWAGQDLARAVQARRAVVRQV